MRACILLYMWLNNQQELGILLAFRPMYNEGLAMHLIGPNYE